MRSPFGRRCSSDAHAACSRAITASIAARSFGTRVMRSARSNRSAMRGGSGGRMPLAPRPRRGTWPDARSRASPSARSGRRRRRGGGSTPIAVCGSITCAGLGAWTRSDRRGLVFASIARRCRISAQAARARPGQREAALVANSPISAATAAPSRPSRSNSSRSKFELTWMSIDGDDRSASPPPAIVAGRQRAVQDVVALVATISRSIGRPMRAGDIAGEHVAEIAGRHREGDRAVRRAERAPRRRNNRPPAPSAAPS